MIGWLMRWVRGPEAVPPPEDEGTRLEGRVHALEQRQRDASNAADRVMDRELRLAYQAMVGDRRRDNLGHMPERRRGR